MELDNSDHFEELKIEDSPPHPYQNYNDEV